MVSLRLCCWVLSSEICPFNELICWLHAASSLLLACCNACWAFKCCLALVNWLVKSLISWLNCSFTISSCINGCSFEPHTAHGSPAFKVARNWLTPSLALSCTCCKFCSQNETCCCACSAPCCASFNAVCSCCSVSLNVFSWVCQFFNWWWLVCHTWRFSIRCLIASSPASISAIDWVFKLDLKAVSCSFRRLISCSRAWYWVLHCWAAACCSSILGWRDFTFCCDWLSVCCCWLKRLNSLL